MAKARRKRPREARFIQVLVHSNEPQLVLLDTAGTSFILAVAVSDPRYTDPFYGAEVSRDQFADFLQERFDLRFLFRRPAYRSWYIIDLAEMDDRQVPINRLQLTPELAKRYLPGAGIFARELTEDVDGAVFTAQTAERFSIDGSWDLPDFSQFYGQYTDIYVVLNSIDIFIDKQVGIDTKRRVQEAFIKPWQGGGSYTAFYDSLLEVQDREERLHVDAIQYASPGFVEVKGRAKTFEESRNLVMHFAKNSEQITQEYNRLHGFLSQVKLLTTPASQFVRTGPIAEAVTTQARLFASTLQAIEFGVLMELARGDQLIAAKVLLSIERRVRKLYEFFLQGRVAFGN